MINQTISEYKQVIEKCREVFLSKTRDYGTAWRIMRLPSITDQIFIKAQRIRSIQEKGTQKVADDIPSEFLGIINYCIIALMQLELSQEAPLEIPFEEVQKSYNYQVEQTIQLLTSKNHDYGEAWRSMRVTSITDIILMKIFRIKQIEDNDGKTTISEGVEGSYRDMINYSVFSLIKLTNENNTIIK